uniref:cystatin-like fold lipoprotein n=1 Tax=Staphylococcus epidermidis TaxID=1282 RepID=UPI0011A210D1
SDIYVFHKPKYVLFHYKPLTGHPQPPYYTYQFKDKKPYYNKHFNPKPYYQSHHPHYKEHNIY